MTPFSTFHSCFLDVLFDNPLSHSAPWQSQSKCNRDYVQSNRGYLMEDLVISIIILYRCNSDTARRCKRLAANLGLLAHAAIFCLGVPSGGLTLEYRQPVGSRWQDRSRPISGATRAGLRAGHFPGWLGSPGLFQRGGDPRSI